jgi:hypothetical protein
MTVAEAGAIAKIVYFQTKIPNVFDPPVDRKALSRVWRFTLIMHGKGS